jgi:hypothetical protein
MNAETARLVDAEIAKLVIEAAKIGDERRARHADETHRAACAETWTMKTVREEIVYPALVAACLIAAGAALFTALSKLAA